MSKELEVAPATPRELIEELEALIEQMSDPKRYQLKAGLRDVEFEVDWERAQESDVSLPVSSIEQAEGCLREGLIAPLGFVGMAGAVHEVLAFDPRPVRFSGFMDSVTHSLTLTDKGLFEVARYPAANLTQAPRHFATEISRLSMRHLLFNCQVNDKRTRNAIAGDGQRIPGTG